MNLSSFFSCAFWSTSLHVVLLFSATLLCLQPNNTASALGNDTDQLSLLRFKEAVQDDPLGILTSWNSSTYFCNWHGVTCSLRHQRVTALNLQGYGLRGLIPSEIGNLTFLRYVNLQNNSFYGEIPQEIGRLFRLQQLYLTNNTLRGQIPTNLSGCSELKSLSLRGNKLVGKIPTELGFLTKLEELYIAVNNLTGEIPASIGNLSSLSILSLGINNLEGNVPEEISHLKNLTHISIASNKLSGMLPSTLYNMSSLTYFSAAVNQFNGSLPSNMFLTLPNLQQFGIGMNKISGPIPASISNATRLLLFNIPRNNFVGQVPIGIGNLQDIWFIALEYNHLGSNSSNDLDFLTSLTNCTKLQVLDLNVNNFGGSLPNSVANFSTQLNQFYIGGNQITGTIPAGLGNLIELIGFELEFNLLTGSIPTSFGKFQKIQLLNLNANKLSGEIPSSIGNLSQLSQLDLSNNILEGSIPPSIGNCQYLQYLDLSHNNLSGTIPLQVLGLPSLSLLLNLSQNSLNGSLPSEVGNLKSINKLDVSKNVLSGEIPATIGECITLEYLNLQGNSFLGAIPSSLASLKGLQYLDLSQNNLSGSIPEGLEGIPFLQYLNISFNRLDGEVPIKGVFRNASAISIKGNSDLCGGITELHLPPCPVKVMTHKKHQAWKDIVIIISVVFFLLLLLSSFVVCWKKRTNWRTSTSPTTVDHLAKVSYQTLHQATNGFSPNNLVGSGAFGSVYKGTFESEEKVVAIKVLNLQKKGAQKSFIAECNALRNIRHRNLVKILTCCSSMDYNGNEFKALVFEYMENGSLEKWLHPESEIGDQPSLDLLQRLNILIDVGSALFYLHHECEQPIVHCDLKPNNILLDNDMVAHVNDFGLARLLSTISGISHPQSSTIGIKGTVGYAPPEYGMGGEVSTLGDMYSFGILVLEILTGRKPTDEMFINGINLHTFVKVSLPDKLLQIVDSAILPRELKKEFVSAEEENNISNQNQSQMHPNDFKKCLLELFSIGLACSAESPKERMNMRDVTRELNVIKNAFFKGRSIETH
ncbi:putative receptor-like protein kinase At3g47110 [Gastrolobium bilobum]|uniref:putative receptor-like protein kinase At3g47110 n=1 Tax=Gastrolobium bilobum TaxID=150636 RepID=UPI002AB1DDBE|nr:putative receptor-like protein kinase At3g47110 [Gastrolobium bilobum]